jgi:hypothetical protein
MTIQEELVDKYNEVCDLHQRGMLSQSYVSAWVDAIKIVNNHPHIKPIHILANEEKMVVRFAADDRGYWKVSIRPKIAGMDAVMFIGPSYQESEDKARKWICSNSLNLTGGMLKGDK